jgi:NAD(P)-dependent dehydrogenase (short-subunit alcohol dehydrogenase family)
MVNTKIKLNRPGIGISIARAFAQKNFDRIAICARNADRLASEKKEVEEAAKAAGRSVEVFTYPTDLTNAVSLRKTLKEIEKLGPLGMVYHNAAKVKFGDPLSETIEEVEDDFKVP